MRRAIVGAMALVLATAASASAAVTIHGIDTTRSPLVRLTVSVDDRATNPAFTVSENGAPVPDVRVTPPTNGNAIELLMDTSGTMAGAPLAREIAAVKAFLTQIQPQDAVGMIEFGHAAALTMPITRDRAALAHGLQDVRFISGGTALHDAVFLAAKDLVTSPPGARRIIVLMTDGKDSSSVHAIQDALQAAQAVQATIYTIVVKTDSYGPRPLQQYAAATGGSFHVATMATLADPYLAIAHEINQTYVLAYRSQATDHVAVSVAADGSSALTGYTAGPPASILRGSGLVPASAVLPSSSVLLLAGGTFVVLLIALLLVFRPRPKRSIEQRLDSYTEFSRRAAATGAEGDPDATSALTQLSRSTERILGGLKFWKRTAKLIEQADLPLRTAEVFYIRSGCALALGVPLTLAGAPGLVAMIGMFVGFSAPMVVIKFKAKGRGKEFDNQLPDTLTAIAASLKAGHSWNQAVDTVIKEGVGPVKDEFSRVASEVRLGRSSDDAMEAMAERIGSTDFEFVTMSVNIQRQIGGSLSELLDQVAETVRARQQFRRKVKALTSMGRMSAYTLVGMPFLMGLGIWAINHAYMDPLLYTNTGHFLMVVALVSMSIGAWILKKIVSFKV
jgi:tight adherence protein B